MKNTIEQIDKQQCTGCGLCAEKCPKDCIFMVEDGEGFRFPQIDFSKCVKCGLLCAFVPQLLRQIHCTVNTTAVIIVGLLKIKKC